MQANVINHTAVLGAGVMGAQIAAHCVNAGFNVKLFDLAMDSNHRNKIVDTAIARLSKLKPLPLASTSLARNIHGYNFSDDLAELSDCQLIIEAVSERLDIKESLYNQITPYINENAIFASNTSGISINKLASFLPLELRKRFCGVHFFNPPRYMHLLELIPGDNTDNTLLDRLETFFVRDLGKGVVRAKDTPNFIANRVGVFSLLMTMHHATKFDLSLDTVDALTGTLIGRPKSATYRTMDVVGLDTMSHVVQTMHENCQDDPWHAFYQLPDWLSELIAKGSLGQKTGQGVYRKNKKQIEVYSVADKTYVPASAKIDDEVKEIFKQKDLKKRFHLLKESTSNQAQFLYHCFLDLFHYCAYHLEAIATTVADIDNAMCWGFGWQQGPFALWQAMGGISGIALSDTITAEKTMTDARLPKWLSSTEQFYDKGAFNPSLDNFQKGSALPVYQRHWSSSSKDKQVIIDDSAHTLWSLDGKNAIISFKSPGNSVGSDLLAGINKALDSVENNYQSLIIWQDSDTNFSLGANLKEFIELFSTDKASQLNDVIHDFQQTATRLKYSSVPVIAAVRGRALGGGLELIMHCDRVVCALESYVGLVEIGVGLLPAGGGLKQLAIKASQAENSQGAYHRLEQYFKSVATAQVATSSLDAKDKGLLNDNLVTVMNSQDILFVAHKTANYLNEVGYKPQCNELIPVMGVEYKARLDMIITNMEEGGFISEHDAMIASHIAHVITGGNLPEGELVDEEWFLKLERDAFVELAQTEKTRARVLHLLETGKPLRN